MDDRIAAMQEAYWARKAEMIRAARLQRLDDAAAEAPSVGENLEGQVGAQLLANVTDVGAARVPGGDDITALAFIGTNTNVGDTPMAATLGHGDRSSVADHSSNSNPGHSGTRKSRSEAEPAEEHVFGNDLSQPIDLCSSASIPSVFVASLPKYLSPLADHVVLDADTAVAPIRSAEVPRDSSASVLDTPSAFTSAASTPGSTAGQTKPSSPLDVDFTSRHSLSTYEPSLASGSHCMTKDFGLSDVSRYPSDTARAPHRDHILVVDEVTALECTPSLPSFVSDEPTRTLQAATMVTREQRPTLEQPASDSIGPVPVEVSSQGGNLASPANQMASEPEVDEAVVVRDTASDHLVSSSAHCCPRALIIRLSRLRMQEIRPRTRTTSGSSALRTSARSERQGRTCFLKATILIWRAVLKARDLSLTRAKDEPLLLSNLLSKPRPGTDRAIRRRRAFPRVSS